MRYKKIHTATKGVIIAAALAIFLIQGMAFADVLKATPSHFDFGTLNEGDPAEVTVEIENTGSAPVEITNVRTS